MKVESKLGDEGTLSEIEKAISKGEIKPYGSNPSISFNDAVSILSKQKDHVSDSFIDQFRFKLKYK